MVAIGGGAYFGIDQQDMSLPLLYNREGGERDREENQTRPQDSSPLEIPLSESGAASHRPRLMSYSNPKSTDTIKAFMLIEGLACNRGVGTQIQLAMTGNSAS